MNAKNKIDDDNDKIDFTEQHEKNILSALSF